MNDRQHSLSISSLYFDEYGEYGGVSKPPRVPVFRTSSWWSPARAHFAKQFVCFLNAPAALKASQRVLLSATDDTLSLVSLTAHLYSLNTHMC